jgi:hypothetical protein
MTTGSVGRWVWLTWCPGQTDWIGTLIAPASRAESAGITTWSSVVQSESQGGRLGIAV